MRTLLVSLLLLATGCLQAATWDAARLQVPLEVNGLNVPHPVFAVYLQPGQPLRVGFADGKPGTVQLGDRQLPTGGDALPVPATPGLHPLRVTRNDTGETATLNVFVVVPAAHVDGRGYLNGYRLGQYPTTPLRGLNIYRPPPGYVEVNEANAGTLLSPNFRLGQFVSKQEQGYPKYVVLRPGLLLKLENILAALNHSGRPTEGLVIMSGYRTPWYNKAIGNVPYSRHVWGGAADIYVDDTPADGRMDDLNGDGRVDRADARWLADFINRMSNRGEFGPRIGGLGVYGSNAAHGPFVHVDVRGSRARW